MQGTGAGRRDRSSIALIVHDRRPSLVASATTPPAASSSAVVGAIPCARACTTNTTRPTSASTCRAGRRRREHARATVCQSAAQPPAVRAAARCRRDHRGVVRHIRLVADRSELGGRACRGPADARHRRRHRPICPVLLRSRIRSFHLPAGQQGDRAREPMSANRSSRCDMPRRWLVVTPAAIDDMKAAPAATGCSPRSVRS